MFATVQYLLHGLTFLLLSTTEFNTAFSITFTEIHIDVPFRTASRGSVGTLPGVPRVPWGPFPGDTLRESSETGKKRLPLYDFPRELPGIARHLRSSSVV